MQVQCAICSDLVKFTENVCVTICGHMFHQHCLVAWINRSKTCPQCRNRVTDKCMFRIYPTISNETSGQDIGTVQSRLDDVMLQLRVLKSNSLEKENELTAITSEHKNTQKKLKESLEKLTRSDSVVAELRQRVEYLQAKNKMLEKFKDENEELIKFLDTLNSIQQVLNDTSEEVEEMLQGYTDPKTVATFAIALKRALCESESKKLSFRDRAEASQKKLNFMRRKYAVLDAKFKKLKEKLTNENKMNESSTECQPQKEQEETEPNEDGEPPLKQPRLDDFQPVLNGALTINDTNISFNGMVNKIENAESPYLNLKQSSLALATLQRPSTSVSGDSKLKPSEFAMLQSMGYVNNKKPDLENVPSRSQSWKHRFDVSYDGLGGHSPLEISFPIRQMQQPLGKPKSFVPKLTAKHKLKKPK